MRHPMLAAQRAFSLKPLARLLALACALGAPLAASAQAVPIPFEVEGTVKGIYNRPDGSGVELTVFGRSFLIPRGATIHTPTRSLNAAELVDPTRFPGLYRDGFMGSTAVMTGEVVIGTDGVARPVIRDLAIEPAETVLIGALTKNDAGTMDLLDIPLQESRDPRLSSKGYKNEFGFAVDPKSVPVGTFAALEGYFGDDGNFYHFAMEVAEGRLVNENTAQTSITKADCVPGSRLQVIGASYLPAAAIIEFRNPKTNYLYGQMNTTLDLEAPQFGTYRYRGVVNEGEVDSDGACPSQVLAVNLTNGSQAIAKVDGVIAPPPPPPADTAPVNTAPAAVADAANVFVGLATEVHLLANDTDANGNMDPTTVQLIFPLPAGLDVQNPQTGDVIVTAAAAGTYVFSYTVADTMGAVSEPASVTITAQPVAMDTVGLTRSNYRADSSRWEVRGTTNKTGAQITVMLVRTGETIATATSDATGAWQIDVRNSPVRAVAGDIVRVISNGGGQAEGPVNIVR